MNGPNLRHPASIYPSASRIVQDVKAGRMTAQSVVSATLQKIAVINPLINAFTAVFATEAMAGALALDAALAAGRRVGPLAGVPFAVKNLFDVEGVATLGGYKIRRDAAGLPRRGAGRPPEGRGRHPGRDPSLSPMSSLSE